MSSFGAVDDACTATARTHGELQKVFSDEKLTDSQGLRMVENFLDRDDAPPGPPFDYMEVQNAGNDIRFEEDEDKICATQRSPLGIHCIMK